MEAEKEIAIPAGQGKNILTRYFTIMPVIFPLIGLFLLGMALFETWNYAGDSEVSPLYWLRPVVLAWYFLFWAGTCLGWRKAGMGFLVLTMINVAFYLFGPDTVLKRALGDILFLPLPVNILFSFLLLFYYRKLR